MITEKRLAIIQKYTWKTHDRTVGVWGNVRIYDRVSNKDIDYGDRFPFYREIEGVGMKFFRHPAEHPLSKGCRLPKDFMKALHLAHIFSEPSKEHDE